MLSARFLVENGNTANNLVIVSLNFLHYLEMASVSIEICQFVLQQSESVTDAQAIVAGSLREQRAKVVDFVETTVFHFNDYQFRDFFRLPRTAVQSLVLKLSPFLSLNSPRGTTVISMILLFLRYLATQESYEALGTLFNLAKSSVCVIIQRVLCAMSDSGFNQDHVRFPSVAECQQYARLFSRKSRQFFTASVIGAIDVKEVKIVCPSDNGEAYYNRKQFHSIKLQIISTSTTHIIDYFIGWPGSSNDARTFQHSPVRQEIHQLHTQYGFRLIGDSAYPCTDFLLTPYKGRNLCVWKRQFNRRLSKLRQCVERTFGTLSRRWQRINYINSVKMDTTAKLIEAICCLHNFSLKNNGS